MSGPLRVIQRYPVWLPQTQTWLYNQVKHLPAAVESHVVCDRTEHLEQFAVPHMHVLAHEPWHRRYGDKALRLARVPVGSFLAERARHSGATVLHSHFGHEGYADMPAARHAGLRHVVTFYGLDVNYLPLAQPRWRARYRALFAHVDRVLCEGPHMGRCLVELGCPQEKVTVQHLGVDLSRMECRPRVRGAGEPLRVLIAAGFREKKGIPDALEALLRLSGEVELEVTVIGDAGAEPRARAEKERILAAAARLGPRVRMMGFQPHSVLLEESYRHHVFLSPSVTAADGDTEGGAPVSLIDMAATGMPIVSTTHCDIPSVVRHGESGLLAPERDVAALVGHLRRLAEHPEAWAAMGLAGRRHVEAEYDARVQGERLAAIYRELAGGFRQT